MRIFESGPVRLDEKATLTSGQHPPWDTFDTFTRGVGGPVNTQYQTHLIFPLMKYSYSSCSSSSK